MSKTNLYQRGKRRRDRLGNKDLHIHSTRRRQWHPTPVFLPGESQGQGAWWAAFYGVAQSRTRLKRLSSSSSSIHSTIYKIDNYKDLLYTTRNSLYSLKAFMGKEF